MKTTEELRLLKKQWYTEAENNRNLYKLSQIARYLGEDVKSNYGPKYRFTDGDFSVYVDDYGHYTTMHMIDRLVCSTHNERLYVKDICDRFIDKHMPAVDKIIMVKKLEQEDKERLRLEKELL